MLVRCKECELQVSDKAFSCPHCGYPMKEEKTKRSNRSRKYKRLPNGFGQISEIKNQNLRKPFRAMVTVGKNEEGRPICKLLKPEAYFATYQEAYKALLDNADAPANFQRDFTMQELYDKWSEQYFNSGIADSTIQRTKYAWRYCYPIYNMQIAKVRQQHLRACLYDSVIVARGVETSAKPHTQLQIKTVLDLLFDYAVEFEYTDKNYSRSFKLAKEIGKTIKEQHRYHIAFSDSEISTLWENADDKDARFILCQCYTGFRPGEIISLETTNVNLNKGYIIGGGKTKAGKDRIVPIHPAIFPIIKEYYDKAVNNREPFLFIKDDKKRHYEMVRRKYARAIKKFGLNEKHTPHDGRKTFVTIAKQHDLDEYAIKYIVGHAITDITEKVYTERNLEWLKREMEKIRP